MICKFEISGSTIGSGKKRLVIERKQTGLIRLKNQTAGCRNASHKSRALNEEWNCYE
jgi:hypothetical protein